MKWIEGFVCLVWLLCSPSSLSLFVHTLWKYCLREYKWPWVILEGIFLQGGVRERGREGESGLTGCGSVAHKLQTPRLEKTSSNGLAPKLHCFTDKTEKQDIPATPWGRFVCGLWRSAIYDSTCLAHNLLNLSSYIFFSRCMQPGCTLGILVHFFF